MTAEEVRVIAHSKLIARLLWLVVIREPAGQRLESDLGAFLHAVVLRIKGGDFVTRPAFIFQLADS